MVDRDLLRRKLAELSEYVSQVSEYEALTVERYRADWKTPRIVERTLQALRGRSADLALGDDMSDTVLVEDQGAVRVLTLNRPTKLNAMNVELVDTLIGAVRAADQDDAVAVVILTGAGRAFSAGADISRGTTEPSPRQVIARARGMASLFRALAECTKPVVAAVHGYVLGGGCSLAMSSDLVVAADNAVFGYPELKAGLAATAVAPALVQQIGRKAAFELLTLCENVNAERALALGMINRVVPRDDLLSEARRISEQLAAWNHDALWMTKRTIQRAASMSAAEALEMASDASLVMRLHAQRGGS